MGFVEPGAAKVHGEAAQDGEGEDFARSRKEVGGDGVGGDVDEGPGGEDTSELVTGVVNNGVFPQVAAHGGHDAAEIFHEFVFEGQVLEVLGEGERFGDDPEEEEGGADRDDGRGPLGDEDEVGRQVEHAEEVCEAAQEDEGDEEPADEPGPGFQAHQVPGEGGKGREGREGGKGRE